MHPIIDDFYVVRKVSEGQRGEQGSRGGGEWPARWEVGKVGNYKRSVKCQRAAGAKIFGVQIRRQGGEAAGEFTSWAQILAEKKSLARTLWPRGAVGN